MARIAVIPGDGIGPEVCDVALRVLQALEGREQGARFEFESFPWGSDYYLQTGAMLPADALETLAGYDAILFGAVGSREVPDHVTLWGLRLAIVQGFDQAISLRPARLFPGVRGPLARRGPGDIDLVVVRENTEGEYSGIGGFSRRSHEGEVAVQTTIYSRLGVERVARYAFELARTRPQRRVASITKSNASPHASVLWDEIVAEVALEFPDVAWESVLVDAAAARLILAPQEFDVLVASNLHGDVLSDLTGALAGSLGMAPSANLCLDGSRPSMYEPVHGSAFDLVGRGLANPIGMILSAALMLDDLALPASAAAVRDAVTTTCAAGVLTRDLGGRATTADVADAIVGALETTRSGARA
jgi:tartrate dehydrogenase/decarboxylase/D-malate dehydrogenase